MKRTLRNLNKLLKYFIYLCIKLVQFMKRSVRFFCLFLLVLAGTTAYSKPTITYKETGKITLSCSDNTRNGVPKGGDSPFIRFHSGITGSNVSVSFPNEHFIPLKPLHTIPEKFTGILGYLSSSSFSLPHEAVFFCATPLRSPPYCVKG